MKCIHSDLVKSIRSSKDKLYLCLSAKLSDPSNSANPYWILLKNFVNGNKDPVIPPLLVNEKLVTNFLEKANIFNDFFSQKYEPLSNGIILTLIPFYYTDNRSKDINFSYENILKTIQSLDSNKAHGHDGASAKMLKLSCPSTIKPLLIIFRNCSKIWNFSGWLEKG